MAHRLSDGTPTQSEPHRAPIMMPGSGHRRSPYPATGRVAAGPPKLRQALEILWLL